MKTKLRIHQIYSNTPEPTPWIKAFNDLIAFPTLMPATKFELQRTARLLHQQMADAKNIHQGLLNTYLIRDEAGNPVLKYENPTWHDEAAFFEAFNELLNQEIEVNTLAASMLEEAVRRYWLLVEKGKLEPCALPDLFALGDFVYDDLTPKEEVVEAKKEEAQIEQAL